MPHDPSLAKVLKKIDRVINRRSGVRSGPNRPRVQTLPPLTDRTFEIPGPLADFLAWHEPERWSWFVNPTRVRKSDGPPTITATGDIIAPGSEKDNLNDPIVVLPPGELTIQSARSNDLVPLSVLFDSFDIYEEEYGWPEQVLDARFIHFAKTDEAGAAYLLALDDRFCPAGRVVLTLMDDPSLMVLEQSLSAWLEHLLRFGGIHLAQFPGSLEDLPRRKWAKWHRRFKASNPHVDFG
jgi:hypothetical protein